MYMKLNWYHVGKLNDLTKVKIWWWYHFNNLLLKVSQTTTGEWFSNLCVSDGYECYSSTRCLFNSTELQDIEFIRSYYYNKIEFVRFSSDVGRFVGYTEFGIKEAEYWNKDQAILAQMRAQKETYCQHNTDLWYANVLSKSGESVFLWHHQIVI